MFQAVNYSVEGDNKQKRAYQAIQALNLMNDLKEFTPILCGTVPIGIDVDTSDLDIIMEVADFSAFEKIIRELYSKQDNFQVKHTNIRGRKVVKANFVYDGFEFELFGQSQPVHSQHAYLHMVIEGALLKENPKLKEKVIQLKKRGYKTEQAFCKVLGIPGDPYENLIIFGKNKGIID